METKTALLSKTIRHFASKFPSSLFLCCEKCYLISGNYYTRSTKLLQGIGPRECWFYFRENGSFFDNESFMLQNGIPAVNVIFFLLCYAICKQGEVVIKINIYLNCRARVYRNSDDKSDSLKDHGLSKRVCSKILLKFGLFFSVFAYNNHRFYYALCQCSLTWLARHVSPICDHSSVIFHAQNGKNDVLGLISVSPRMTDTPDGRCEQNPS